MNKGEIKAISEGVVKTFKERARIGAYPDIQDVLDSIEFELVEQGHMRMWGDRSKVRFEYNGEFGEEYIDEVDDSMDIWEAHLTQAQDAGKIVGMPRLTNNK